MRSIEDEMAATLNDAGCRDLRRGHFTVFRALDPDGMRMTDLARDAGVTRQAIAQLVADLHGLGLLEVVPDPADGRAKLVRYTEHGKAGYDIAMSAARDIEAGHERRLGADALSLTREMLGRIGEEPRARAERMRRGPVAADGAGHRDIPDLEPADRVALLVYWSGLDDPVDSPVRPVEVLLPPRIGLPSSYRFGRPRSPKPQRRELDAA